MPPRRNKPTLIDERCTKPESQILLSSSAMRLLPALSQKFLPGMPVSSPTFALSSPIVMSESTNRTMVRWNFMKSWIWPDVIAATSEATCCLQVLEARIVVGLFPVRTAPEKFPISFSGGNFPVWEMVPVKTAPGRMLDSV